MKKIKFFFIIIFFILISQVFALDKVENIFKDIKKDSPNYDKLQDLYDKWAITPDENWNFNPSWLLTKNNLFKVSSKISCEQETKTFDIPSSNSNNISLEEAVYVLLKKSNLFTESENNTTLSSIRNWIITENLSKDVSPKNNFWEANFYYWYLKKALEFEYSEYDIYGKEFKTNLISLDQNWNLNPKKNLTNQEFLNLIYIISKINPCFNNKDNLINLSQKSWEVPLRVIFNTNIYICEECSYEWNFWDGKKSNKKTDENIFTKPWFYNISLKVTKKDKTVLKAETSVEAKKDLSKIDSDGDWVFDDKDKCINTFGSIENDWCPILQESCLVNSEKNTCKSWFICSNNWFCEVDKNFYTPKNKTEVCLTPKNGSSIYGNVSCNSCPCDYSIDFLASIRKCDIIIPAIVSKDGKNIYSKWPNYLIK